ncbi:hypothetical protein JCGZ_15004 [Jatropha curcas]|uniref:Uncharacterized protein n=1 Tax=Jatropha curcas TaxID=180498 RepID=A0A067KIT5_JATCU|nr:hypothetical protein JCGZ_15004 [Jatropha curcas]
MGGDYDEFCRTSLMQPIGSRLDSFQRPAPSQPLGTRFSRASGPSTRTLRRRPMTDPTSSTPVEGPSRAGPSHSAGPYRAPRAILEVTEPLHPDLANLRLPYSIPYYPPDGPPALQEVWLKDHLQVVAAPTLLPYSPSQYRMRRILISHPSTDAWTSWLIELGPNESLTARDDSEDVAPRRRRDT